MLGLTVAICALSATLLTRQVLTNELMDVGEVLQALVPHLVRADIFDKPPGTDAGIARAFEGLVPSKAIVRAMVYDRRGHVLWSDDPALVGRDLSHAAGVRAALAGQMEVAIIRPGHERHENTLRSFDRLVELYVPVRYGKTAPVVGVVEVYRDAPRLFAVLDRNVAVLWLSGAVAGLGLYGSLFMIVRRASARQIGLQEELAAHARTLEDRVAERTRELRDKAHEVKATRDYLRNIIQSSADAIVTIDNRARITFVSRAAVAVFGYRQEELLGTHVRVYWRGGAIAYRAFRRTLSERGAVQSFETTLRRSDGRPVVVEISASLLRGFDGAPLGIVAVLRDVTELRGLQEQIVQAERLATAGLLAAGVAHEVGNPLTCVSSLAQVLRQQSVVPEVQRGLDDIQVHVARIDRIVRELTRVARPSPVQLRDASVEEVLDSAIQLARHAPAARKTAISVRNAGTSPRVRVDPDRLAQVFLNLILNAADAGGDLTIHIAAADGEVRAVFSDTGRGMPPEEMAQVFDPFFSTKQNGHAGLGLFVSQETVRQHGGRIVVDSRPGEGSTFTVVLPWA